MSKEKPQELETTTTKDLAKEMTPEQIEQLKVLTGEATTMKPRTTFPVIKVDQDKYTFVIETASGTEELGEEFTGKILKMRKKLLGFSPNGDAYYSHEFDNFGDVITLFSKGAPMMEGTVDEIQQTDEYSFVKQQYILYVLKDDTVYKVAIKGHSLGNLFDFLKAKKDDSLIMFETKFSLSELQEKGRNKWKDIVLTKGKVEFSADAHERLKELMQFIMATEHQEQILDKDGNEIPFN